MSEYSIGPFPSFEFPPTRTRRRRSVTIWACTTTRKRSATMSTWRKRRKRLVRYVRATTRVDGRTDGRHFEGVDRLDG